MKHNVFANCKTIEELDKQYELSKMGCETLEWYRVIKTDYGIRLKELQKEQGE